MGWFYGLLQLAGVACMTTAGALIAPWLGFFAAGVLLFGLGWILDGLPAPKKSEDGG